MSRTWSEHKFGYMSMKDSNEEMSLSEELFSGSSMRTPPASAVQSFHRAVSPSSSARGNYMRSTPPPSGIQNVSRTSTPVSRGNVRKGRRVDLFSTTFNYIRHILDLFLHSKIFADSLLLLRFYKKQVLIVFLIFIPLLWKLHIYSFIGNLLNAESINLQSQNEEIANDTLVRTNSSHERDLQRNQSWLEMEEKIHTMLEIKWQKFMKQMENKWKENMQQINILQKNHLNQIKDITFDSKTTAKEVAELKLQLQSKFDDGSMNHTYTYTQETIEKMLARISQVEEKCNILEDQLINHKHLCMQQIGLNVQLSTLAQDLQTNFSQLLHTRNSIGDRSDHVSASISRKEITNIIDSAIKRYDSDKTGLVDYALESAGASVVHVRNTETYAHGNTQFTIFGVPFWKSRNSPRTVLQPQVHPGECWAMRGSHGSLIIRLFAAIHVAAFSLEHIPKSLAPMENIDSAPREFSVFGLDSDSDEEGFLFGNYTYLDTGDSLQTFYVQNTQDRTFTFIEMRVHGNHGNSEYTCVYRFRVHGTQKK